MNTTQTHYTFKLREHTEFTGQFSQKSIKIRPAALNGSPVDITVSDIRRIQRVDDSDWISPHLKYFVFELHDNTRIAGKPVEKTCVVQSTMFDRCKSGFVVSMGCHIPSSAGVSKNIFLHISKAVGNSSG